MRRRWASLSIRACSQVIDASPHAFHNCLQPFLTRLPLCLVLETISKMAAAQTVELLWVPSGGHNPLDTPKTRREESNASIVEAVGRFVSGASNQPRRASIGKLAVDRKGTRKHSCVARPTKHFPGSAFAFWSSQAIGQIGIYRLIQRTRIIFILY